MDRLKRIFLFSVISLMLFSPTAYAQFQPESMQALLESLSAYQWMQKEVESKWSLWMMASEAPQEIDVQQYTMDIEFFPATYSIAGVVTIEAVTKAVPVDTIYIDCHDALSINSLQFDSAPKSYTHSDNRIALSFSPALSPSQAFVVEIGYQGTFTPSQGEGLIFDVHGASVPVISTLSEPYLAPSWWPCIDNPNDKAPIEIYITCPSEISGEQMVGVSNGSLTATTDNGDGTTTFHWSETYPIATYLVAVAISNYIEITSLPAAYNSMPLSYYAYPEHLTTAEYHFAQVYDLIDLFSLELGEYPFIDEKHGIIEIPMASSGMEHQTITCIESGLVGDAEDDYYARVIVGHEISHQWFGDYVTMKTWNDLWLNEGLATFFQFYFREAFGEIPAVINKLSIFNTNLFGDSYLSPVYIRDVTDPFANSGAVYFKGAWVVHMLREMIDDDVLFFSILDSYLANHAHSNTETADLKASFEAGMGADMGYYFDQWIYTPAWPVYDATYETSSREGGYKIDINLRQTQEHDVVDITENPLRNYYIMPIEFTVHYKDLTTEIFKVTNDQRDQSFQLLTVKEPDHTVFDQNLNILRDVTEKVSDNDGIPIDGDYSGIPGDNFCTGGVTENCDDNCPDMANPSQADTCPPGGNGCGDACECEGNFQGNDVDCDGTDAAIFKVDFGRTTITRPCTAGDPCNGDFTCNGNVDGTDAARFKADFGRNSLNNPCPACATVPWCVY